MKKVVKYLSIAIPLTIGIPIALLFVPPITRTLVQTSLNHFLKVDADVTEAVFTLSGLRAEGQLNQQDTFELAVMLPTFSSARITLHYDGNVNTFSKLATVELPYISTVLDATYTTDDLMLELNATLLQGTLNADLNVNDWTYHYQIDKVDLDSYRTQQPEPFAKYATGRLSAKGSGIINPPYTVDFAVQSHQLQLEKTATTLISPELGSPLPIVVDINGSIGTDRLKGELNLKSTIVDLDMETFAYDFNQSRFDVRLALLNYEKKIIPLGQASLELNGSIDPKRLHSSALLAADGYQLSSKKIEIDRHTNDVALDYKLTSLKPKPLDLRGDLALFGELTYTKDGLIMTIGSKSFKSPVLLTLKDDKLHLILNSMPMETLQKIVNQPVIVKGDIMLEADADLNTTPALWKADLVSKNLQLPWEYRKGVGLKNDLALTLRAHNEVNGDIVIRPTLWSNIGLVNQTDLRYRPSSEILFFNLNAQKIETTYYKAPTMNLKGSLNLKEERFATTTLTAPYDKIVLNDLDYTGNAVKSHLEFATTRLDRFARLNPDYPLTGNLSVDYRPQKTTLKLISPELGTLSFEQKNNVTNMTAKALPIENLMQLTNEVVVMQGDLSAALRYTPSTITAKVTSDKISGYGDLEKKIRPFPLDFSTSLKNNKDRYRGQATLKTANETFTLSKTVVDLSKQTLKSHYELAVDAMEKNTLILPDELKGPLHAHGSFEQDGIQHLTLDITQFQLPLKWHQLLDKNASSHLDTNASLELYNDQGAIRFDATVTNPLLDLNLFQSDYDLKTGSFHLNSVLKTELWLKDTNLSAAGRYHDEQLLIPAADIDTAHMHASLETLSYRQKDQNLSSDYKLELKTYPGAPYHDTAAISGHIHTKPALYATAESQTLGGVLDARITDQELRIKAEDLSVVKLIAFSGKELPITSGTLNADIEIKSPSLLDSNRSRLKGKSDINLKQVLLQGVAIDPSLKSLRDSQDLSLFQGSLTELPIVRSITNIPTELTRKKLDQTLFQEMRFVTDINNSMLHCRDCAVTTAENLIAVQGDVNLTSKRFDRFYVGLLYPNNCAYFIQKIEGDLNKPEVKLAAAGFNIIGGATKSLVGNIGSALDLGADIVKDTGTAVGSAARYVPIVGERTDKVLTRVTDAPKKLSASATSCTPFYNGSLKHPKAAPGLNTKEIMEELDIR